MSQIAGAVTSEDGSRYYPVDGQDYWSVTTALKIMSGGDGLLWWSATLAAEGAFEKLPQLVASRILKPCGNTHNRCKGGKNGHDWRETCERCPCKVCSPCLVQWMRSRHTTVRDERADEGKAAHNFIEHWVQTGGEHLPVPPEVMPYVRAFLTFVAAYGLRPDDWLFTECKVINHAERYAGTTDGGIRFHAGRSDRAAELVARVRGVTPRRAVLDEMSVDLLDDAKTKTPLKDGAKPKIYPEVALQLAAYRHAPTIEFKPTGERHPMPNLDGALVLQLYPDLAVPRLVRADELTYAAFLCALNLYRWSVEAGGDAVAEDAFPLLLDPELHPVGAPVDGLVRPARKAATPRKTAAKKATPRAAAAAPAGQSATLASMTAKPAPHPKSPMGDHIPF